MIYVQVIKILISMTILMGSIIPICQFGLSLVIFRPVSTLSFLTVFYIYVDGFAGVTGLGDGAATRDEDGGGGGPCVLTFDHDMYLSMICI